MKAKKYIISTIALALLALIVVGIINVLFDPLFIYHKPLFGLQPVITNERYQNAGVAKNFDYDNVIIGNSLSQNFKPSDFNEGFGGNTVKLTSAGSHTIDWRTVVRLTAPIRRSPANCTRSIVRTVCATASMPAAPQIFMQALKRQGLFAEKPKQEWSFPAFS